MNDKEVVETIMILGASIIFVVSIIVGVSWFVGCWVSVFMIWGMDYIVPWKFLTTVLFGIMSLFPIVGGLRVLQVWKDNNKGD